MLKRIGLHPINTLFSVAMVAFCFSACQKEDNKPIEEKPPEVVSASGTLYETGCLGISSFDIATGTFNWTTSLGVYGDARTPFYDSGYLYVAGPYSTSAVNASTGKLQWQLHYYTGVGYYSSTSFKGRVSPVVKDSILYTMGFDGPNFNIYLYAINKRSGNYLWKAQIYDYWTSNVIAQPKIIQNKILVVTYNGINCFDRVSGSLLWQVNLTTVGIDPAFYPQVDNNSIYVYDKTSNRIVAFDASTGAMSSKSIPMPADFDGNSFELNGNYITGSSKHNASSSSFRYYMMEKATGTVLNPGASFANGYLFVDQIMNEQFYMDMTTDDASVYIYNPITVRAYNRADFKQQWESSYPSRKIIDSLKGMGLILSGKLIVTDNSLIQLSSFRYVNPPVVEDLYVKMEIVNKKDGKVIGSFPFSNPSCYGVPYIIWY